MSTTPESSDTALIGAEFVLGLGLAAASVAVLGLILLRAGTKAPRTMVVVSLSILTLAGLMIYAATEAAELLSLIGAGFGALAGAVTALFADKKIEESHPPEGGPDTIAPIDEKE